MSYTIVYNKVCLKSKKGLIFPLVLAGCNNVTEGNYSLRLGRTVERRARDWSVSWHMKSQLEERNLLADTDAYIKKVRENIEKSVENINSFTSDEPYSLDSYDYYGLKINGSPCTYKKQISYFVNSAKKAISVEEFLELNNPFSVHIVISEGWNKPEIESKSVDITCGAALDELNDWFQKTDKSKYYTIYFYGLDEKPRFYQKPKVPRQKIEVDHYFSIVSEDGFYVRKKTRSSLYKSYSPDYAKKFKTEKQAEKYIEEKIKGRFSKKYLTKRIDNPVYL